MIKYCRAEYATLAISRGRVRIGTVHGYQRIENSFLRDGSEGVRPYIIAAGQNDFVLSNAESNAVMQSPGFELINDWKLALPAGARTKLIPSSFNTLVFSMSVGDDPDGAIMRKLGYDSYYRILDPDQFALRLANAIRQTLGIPHEVRYARADCVYVDEKGIVVTESTRSVIRQFERSVSIADLFTKERDRFGEEREHRIVWFLHSGNGQYASIHGLDHLDVECPDIVELLAR